MSLVCFYILYTHTSDWILYCACYFWVICSNAVNTIHLDWNRGLFAGVSSGGRSLNKLLFKLALIDLPVFLFGT